MEICPDLFRLVEELWMAELFNHVESQCTVIPGVETTLYLGWCKISSIHRMNRHLVKRHSRQILGPLGLRVQAAGLLLLLDSLHEPLSKLLVSPLISPTMVPYIIP